MFIRRTAVLEAIVLLLVIVLPILSEKAEAAGLQQVWVRLDRMQASTTTGGTVCVKTAVADVTESNVAVTFPSDFTLNETATNWTVTTTNLPSGATAWAGIATATSAVDATKIATFPSSNLTADTLYCFNFTGTSTLTTGSAGASKTGTVATGGNSSAYATAVISDDQIDITATVPATFSFVLSANASDLGTLSSSSISSGTGVTVTIGTNAAAGWVTWVKSANAALNSSSTGASIATAGTVNDTPEDLDSVTGYVLDVDRTTDAGGGCTLQQNPSFGDEYDGTDATQGGSLSTTFQPIAECVTGTANSDVITLIPRAKIVATQAAATDYADTLTVVGAGRF